MKSSLCIALSLAAVAFARPGFYGRSDLTRDNGGVRTSNRILVRALTAGAPCTGTEQGCIGDGFAQCVNGKLLARPCAPGTVCSAGGICDFPKAGGAQAAAAPPNPPPRAAAPAKPPAAPAKPPAAPAKPPAAPAKPPAAPAKPPAAPATPPAAPAKPPAAPAKPPAAPAKPPAAPAKPPAAPAKPPAAAPPASSAPPTAGKPGAGDNAASGAAAGAGGDAQTSHTLLDSVIAPGFAQDGSSKQDPGQVPSLTSTNNYINFCAGKKLTNGQQIVDGSCNPAPMGIIAAKSKMPSSKFISPQNGDQFPANTNITVKMAVRNLETGFFTNPDVTYFASPQQVNAQGIIQGHSHVTVDRVPSLTDTTPTDPEQFAWFKGLNGKARGGVLTATIAGLSKGTYRISSINAAANHQPVLVAVAQHGALDDMVYFDVV